MKHKIFHRYLSAKVLPIWTILLIDVLIIVVSSLLAYALRYDFRSIFLESSTIDKTIVWTVIVNLVFFRVPHLFQRIALFFVYRHYAHFCFIDGVLCTVNDFECAFGKLSGYSSGTCECTVYGVYH